MTNRKAMNILLGFSLNCLFLSLSYKKNLRNPLIIKIFLYLCGLVFL